MINFYSRFSYKAILTNSFQKAFFLTFLLFASQGVTAQQKPAYSLLWKISGKGLIKPSYIFGTMHVKDKRAFTFSDSVMLAIQSCPSFALEVHPDTLIKQMFNSIQDGANNSSLHKLLSEEEYNKLDKRFQAKNGYPLGDIDPIQAESMMRPIKDKPDDKKTFVDAFLFGIARGMSKNIYGLENSSEQLKDYSENSKIKSRLLDLLEDDEEDELEQTEDMIDLYSTGNLQEIAQYIGNEHLGDSVLIGRNKVMAKSILMYIAQQPLFAAVGVAHLPGDNGLIALLKDAGYTVTPVKATFTGIANNFNTDYSKHRWQTYTDEEQGYTVNYPFEPIKTNLSYGLTAVIYPDMANDMFFGTYAVLTGPKSLTDAYVTRVIKNLKNKDTRILSKKSVLINGNKGTDIITESKNRHITRYLFFAANKYLYCVYAGNDEKSVNSAYTNRFFNSFKIFKPANKPDQKWITYKNDTAAFSITLPMRPLIVTKQITNPKSPENPFTLHMYLGTDSINLINYIVRYNDYPKGLYLSDKAKSFDILSNELKSNGAVVQKISTIHNQGYEGREIIFKLKGYNCKAQYFIRGNRIYFILKQNLNNGDINQGYDFFKTFKFIPYASSSFQTYSFQDSTYSAKLFQEIISPNDTLKNYESFLLDGETAFSTNIQSGGVFGLEKATFSKYYRVPSVDSAYSILSQRLIAYNDTLLKKDTITVNGLKGLEIITQNKFNKEKKRRRLIIDHNNVFTMMSYTADEELFTDASNEFYNSLHSTGKVAPASLNTSKAELIVNDLLSHDSTTYKYALGALSYYKFGKEELNYLTPAVQKKYSDDTTEQGARVKIVEAIAEIKDPTSLNTLVNLYNTSNSDYIKTAALNAIVKVDTIKGYDTYFDLLTKSPALNTELSYRVFKPLYDSVKIAAANYEKLVHLIKHPEYRRTLLSVTQSLVDEKYISLIKKHFNELTRYANDDLNKYLSDTTDTRWKYGIYNYLQIMTSVKDEPLTQSFTDEVIKKDAYDAEVSDAVIARLENSLPVSAFVINRLLDSADLRYNILKTLSKHGKLAMAPFKYRTQQEFAKMCLNEFVQSEDEENARNVKLLGTITEKQNQYFFFKFELGYDDNLQYTAVCGPYKIGSNKLDFTILRSYTAWNNNPATWKIQAPKLMSKLKELNNKDLKSLHK